MSHMSHKHNNRFSPTSQIDLCMTIRTVHDYNQVPLSKCVKVAFCFHFSFGSLVFGVYFSLSQQNPNSQPNNCLSINECVWHNVLSSNLFCFLVCK